MLNELKQHAAEHGPIRVGLVGAGAMGLGVAWQVSRTPGMQLVFVGDIREEALERIPEVTGKEVVRVASGSAIPALGPEQIVTSCDCLSLLTEDNALDIDVLVEASNTIGPAARYCFAAIEKKAHVVLMNAEVDLALGPLLQHEAKRHGVVVTSDAGDQHGVLARMLEEISLWNFDIVQAGNIKGFLNRYATAESLIEEAAKRNLNPVQCCAYTDGTKLCIEMAVIANGTGMVPLKPGMEGPACSDVDDVLNHFRFDRYPSEGVVDYVLGAQPGGGVYIIGHCDDPIQAEYLRYYKLGNAPWYVFYRPYHLCHVETPFAIASAVLFNKPILTPARGRVADVYAYAKSDLTSGQTLAHGIGGDECYGLIEKASEADLRKAVPIALMEHDAGMSATLKKDVPKDRPISYADISLPDTHLNALFLKQERLLSAHV